MNRESFSTGQRNPGFFQNLVLSLGLIGLCLFCLCAIYQDAHAFPTVYPTGTTIYEADKTYDGYTMYQRYEPNAILLIDMNGDIVHEWTSPDLTLWYAEPLSDGSILALASTDTLSVLVELDWNGNVVWQIETDKSRYNFHHDFERLENGNTLVLLRSERIIPHMSPDPIKDDLIVEVTPERELVWVWDTSAHFAEFGFTEQAKELMAESDGDIYHTNTIRTLPVNSHDDSRFREGNILVSQRSTNLIFVIDKETGDIVWKIGPNDNMTIGQHDVHMIPEGYSGAGNILIFDNGGPAGFPLESRDSSRVIEIDPITRDVVWSYDAHASGAKLLTFFSPFVSGMHRLPNGNTLIDEGAFGRFFEVTPEGEIVWEYVNPFFAILPESVVEANTVYRIWRVPLDWPPF